MTNTQIHLQLSLGFDWLHLEKSFEMALKKPPPAAAAGSSGRLLRLAEAQRTLATFLQELKHGGGIVEDLKVLDLEVSIHFSRRHPDHLVQFVGGCESVERAIEGSPMPPLKGD